MRGVEGSGFKVPSTAKRKAGKPSESRLSAQGAGGDGAGTMVRSGDVLLFCLYIIFTFICYVLRVSVRDLYGTFGAAFIEFRNRTSAALMLLVFGGAVTEHVRDDIARAETV